LKRFQQRRHFAILTELEISQREIADNGRIPRLACEGPLVFLNRFLKLSLVHQRRADVGMDLAQFRPLFEDFTIQPDGCRRVARPLRRHRLS
jgi:hypothetical protein